MVLHRQHIRAFLQALLIPLAFAACADYEEFTVDTVATEPTQTEKSYYLALQFDFGGAASVTRADENGSNAEHLIGPSGNVIILFDNEDKLYGVYPLNTTFDFDEETAGEENQSGKEANYLRILRFASYEGEQSLPTQALVVLNANDKMYYKIRGEFEVGKSSMSDVLEVTWGAKENEDPRYIGFSDETRKYFTMTNATYVEDGEAKTAVSIIGKVCPTVQEAQQNPVEVYVERMVAKYTFSIENTKDNTFQPSETPDIVLFNGFTNGNTSGAPEYIAKRWKIQVTGWNINAHERTNYLFKKITPGANYFDDWDWENNNSRRYVSWSEDPDYGKYKYPWQHRGAVDQTDLAYYENFENYLRNYSFTDLKLFEAEEQSFGKSVYTTEHTYNNEKINELDQLDGRNELLAGTHLLVGANLLIEDGGTEGDGNTYEVKDLYRDRNGLYYLSEKLCFVAMVHAFNQLLKSQEIMEFTPYDWSNGGQIDTESKFKSEGENTWVANTSGEYMLYYDDQPLDDEYLGKILKDDFNFVEKLGTLAPATLRGGDGKCLPWLLGSISDRNGKLTIKKKTGENSYAPMSIHQKEKDMYGATIAGEVDHRRADADDIMSLLYEWLGPIDHFKDGKMYYASGIYHHKLNDDKLYGVVRNSWYKLKLTDIKCMGIPVDDPTQPIVPEQVGNNDQLNVSVEFLPWHFVETETPKLSELPKIE